MRPNVNSELRQMTSSEEEAPALPSFPEHLVDRSPRARAASLTSESEEDVHSQTSSNSSSNTSSSRTSSVDDGPGSPFANFNRIGKVSSMGMPELRLGSVGSGSPLHSPRQESPRTGLALNLGVITPRDRKGWEKDAKSSSLLRSTSITNIRDAGSPPLARSISSARLRSSSEQDLGSLSLNPFHASLISSPRSQTAEDVHFEESDSESPRGPEEPMDYSFYQNLDYDLLRQFRQRERDFAACMQADAPFRYIVHSNLPLEPTVETSDADRILASHKAIRLEELTIFKADHYLSWYRTMQQNADALRERAQVQLQKEASADAAAGLALSSAASAAAVDSSSAVHGHSK